MSASFFIIPVPRTSLYDMNPIFWSRFLFDIEYLSENLESLNKIHDSSYGFPMLL